LSVRQANVQNQVEAWQARLGPLGVGHFRVTGVNVVEATPAGPQARATVLTHSDYDSAEFWFTKDFLKEADERELAETIIHEWLHVAMRDLDETLELIENWMPPATFEQFDTVLDREREGFIDRLSRTIYEIHQN
jgi:hypothetical protein